MTLTLVIYTNYYLQLCDTYPRHIYVPTCAKRVQIIGSSKFRSRGRLPVLSYLHSSNQVGVINQGCVIDRGCVINQGCFIVQGCVLHQGCDKSVVYHRYGGYGQSGV